MNSNEVEIKIYRSHSVRDVLPIINYWLVYYREFPFLYIPEGEVPPNHILAEDPEAFVVLAKKRDKFIGLLTGIPLNSPLLDVKYTPFPVLNKVRANGFDLNEMLYIPAFLVSKEERGNQHLILQIYQTALSLAKERGKNQVCYFTTIREDNHPLKPDPYVCPEPWDDLPNPFQKMGITFNLTWPTLQSDGSVKKCENKQELYFQRIS
jgi:hypothetical protein